MESNNKKEPTIRISYDELQAFMMVPILPTNENYRLDELLAVISKRGIRYGIKQDVLLSIINGRVFGREVLIAEGTPKVDGEDGFYQYNFNVDFNKKPKVREDGSVDYWSIHAIETVEEGQVIAIYNPPIEGKNGMSVTGKTLLCKRGRPMPPLSGRGFERSEDGKVYTASMSGKIEFKNNRIMISSVYEVYGNVDIQTGNIDFRGDVIIHGNVLTGATIKATGSITVDGTSEGCVIDAGKDIILRGGMVGGDRAHIKAQGNIFAKFIEYSTVEAQGFIEADSAMNSTIISYDKIFFNGRRASVVGGRVIGCGGVEANNFGNEAEVKTEISVGVTTNILEKHFKYKQLLDETESMLDKVNFCIEEFDNQAREKNLDLRQDERRVALLRTRIMKQAEQTTYRDELARINSIIDRSRGSTVKVYRNVYPGVEVHINELNLRIPTRQTSVEFIERNSKILPVSIAGEMYI